MSSSISREVIVKALISCLCLRDQSGLPSVNCHIYAITGNCSASLELLADLLRVISTAVTGNSHEIVINFLGYFRNKPNILKVENRLEQLLF